MKAFRRIVLSVLLLAALAGLAGAVSAKDLLKVRVGVSPVMSSAGLFLAFEKGYFRQEGLDVELVPFKSSGPEMLPLLATDKLEVGGGNLGASFYNALSRDVKIKVVADKGSNLPGTGYLALVARKGLTVKSPADLKGCTVSFTGKGVSQEIVFDRWMRSGGLGVQDAKVVTMAYQDANVAMAGGSLDATVQIEPLLTEALAKGFATFVKSADSIYPGQQSAALFYSESFSGNTAAARGFMKAYLRGVRDYHRAFVQKKSPAPEIQMMRKHVPVKDASLYTRMKPVGLNQDGFVNVTSMNSDLKWYRDHGYVKDAPSLETVIDHSYAKWAAEQLGRRTK